MAEVALFCRDTTAESKRMAELKPQDTQDTQQMPEEGLTIEVTRMLAWRQIVREALHNDKFNRYPNRITHCCFKESDDRCETLLPSKKIHRAGKLEADLPSMLDTPDVDIDEDYTEWPNGLMNSVKTMAKSSLCQRHETETHYVSKFIRSALRKALRDEAVWIASSGGPLTKQSVMRNEGTLKEDSLKGGGQTNPDINQRKRRWADTVESARDDLSSRIAEHATRMRQASVQQSWWKTRVDKYQQKWRNIEGETLFAPRESAVSQLIFPVDSGQAEDVNPCAVHLFLVNAITLLPTTMSKLTFLHTEKERWSADNINRTFPRMVDAEDIKDHAAIINAELDEILEWQENIIERTGTEPRPVPLTDLSDMLQIRPDNLGT